jgi:hypothetical protein
MRVGTTRGAIQAKSVVVVLLLLSAVAFVM